MPPVLPWFPISFVVQNALAKIIIGQQTLLLLLLLLLFYYILATCIVVALATMLGMCMPVFIRLLVHSSL